MWLTLAGLLAGIVFFEHGDSTLICGDQPETSCICWQVSIVDKLIPPRFTSRPVHRQADGTLELIPYEWDGQNPPKPIFPPCTGPEGREK